MDALHGGLTTSRPKMARFSRQEDTTRLTGLPGADH
jgi:hypothetical protein